MADDSDLATLIHRAEQVGRLAVLTAVGYVSLGNLTLDDELRALAEQAQRAAFDIVGRITLGLMLTTRRSAVDIIGTLGFSVEIAGRETVEHYDALSAGIDERYGDADQQLAFGRAMLERMVPVSIVELGDFRLNLTR